MNSLICIEILKNCERHADRLRWAMESLRPHLPFTATTLPLLTDVEVAILDQVLTRFSKLQDTMGAKLFPEVLEITKEQGELATFIDKLHRLEKIGAVASADEWLLLREMRNAFSHEYPDDPEMQAALLNKAFKLAVKLLEVLDSVQLFLKKYL